MSVFFRLLCWEVTKEGEIKWIETNRIHRTVTLFQHFSWLLTITGSYWRLSIVVFSASIRFFVSSSFLSLSLSLSHPQSIYLNLGCNDEFHLISFPHFFHFLSLFKERKKKEEFCNLEKNCTILTVNSVFVSVLFVFFILIL